ncbi:MAG: topoisomerase IV [Clostridia bacterium]|nr:topoisomerase IV [Clostridia bacterium]
MPEQAHIAGAGEITEQEMTETLTVNYMPYAMSVILSRAIPEIDGFKPSHRKLLYTMYKMGLLNNPRTKSANIVGSTMKLNPHGDQAIYETMVRLTAGNEALLHPYVDSKGNFGKAYSKNMQYAASRYTEAKLAPIARELFSDIDMDTVDMVDNYDSTTTEPTLFPVTFPSVLVNANSGIAVGMASNICSFNLREVCAATEAFIKDPGFDPLDYMPAPDFPGGGAIVFDRNALDEIYRTGRGGVRVRSVWKYDKSANCIDVTQIPPTTTSEQIIDKIIDLAKAGKLRDVSDVRDETDKSGLKITIDLKRGVDPEKLMLTLFKRTPLEESFPCNFNILVGGTPMVMGVRDILDEWVGFRRECVKRRTYFKLSAARDRLHLLEGLEKILLDIDKAIKIIRETEQEAEVVPNLMLGFGIDKIQAEFVAEIRLRHLNREYILKRTADIENLKNEIAGLEELLGSSKKISQLIISELREVADKYGQDRRSAIIYDAAEAESEDAAPQTPSYPVSLFFTKEGYFKKITPQSLRLASKQTLKEGDEIVMTVESDNAAELLFFTDMGNCYKAKADDFKDSKASAFGDYVPAALEFDEGEKVLFMAVTMDFKGSVLFFFANGKVARVELAQYATKNRRKKLVNAVSTASPLVAVHVVTEEKEFVLDSSNGRHLIFNTGFLAVKTTKNTAGVNVMTLRRNATVTGVREMADGLFADPKRYRCRAIPAAGSVLAGSDAPEQLSF